MVIRAMAHLPVMVRQWSDRMAARRARSEGGTSLHVVLPFDTLPEGVLMDYVATARKAFDAP